jgi:hypothetical protein
MKNFKLGYHLSQDYNYQSLLTFKEFEYSFLHRIGYNLGVLKIFFLNF